MKRNGQALYLSADKTSSPVLLFSLYAIYASVLYCYYDITTRQVPPVSITRKINQAKPAMTEVVNEKSVLCVHLSLFCVLFIPPYLS